MYNNKVSNSKIINSAGTKIKTFGRGVALLGVLLPLILIGSLKFTTIEIEALRPLIGGTPWLAWLYGIFGEAGTSYLLGSVELMTAGFLILSLWFPLAGIIGGALALAAFTITSSTMLALPIWEAQSGGFPWLNATGQFLIKDLALLGVAIVVLGENLVRHADATGARYAAITTAPYDRA